MDWMCVQLAHTHQVPVFSLLLELVGIPLLLCEYLVSSRPDMVVQRLQQTLGQGDKQRLPGCEYYTRPPHDICTHALVMCVEKGDANI